ncbi:hypothetical protein ScPMuIL_005683 [Solemya velum]
MRQLVCMNEKVSKKKQKTYYDRKARHRVLERGQKVLLLLPTSKSKLLAQWKGPYEVVERVSPVDYRIRLSNKEHVYHINMLKRWFDREDPDEKSVDIAKDDVISCLHVISALASGESAVDEEPNEIPSLSMSGKETVDDVTICSDLTREQNSLPVYHRTAHQYVTEHLTSISQNSSPVYHRAAHQYVTEHLTSISQNSSPVYHRAAHQYITEQLTSMSQNISPVYHRTAHQYITEQLTSISQNISPDSSPVYHRTSHQYVTEHLISISQNSSSVYHRTSNRYITEQLISISQNSSPVYHRTAHQQLISISQNISSVYHRTSHQYITETLTSISQKRSPVYHRIAHQYITGHLTSISQNSSLVYHRTTHQYITEHLTSTSQNISPVYHRTAHQYITEQLTSMSQNISPVCHRTAHQYITEQLTSISQNSSPVCHRTSHQYVTEHLTSMSQNSSPVFHRRAHQYITDQLISISQNSALKKSGTFLEADGLLVNIGPSWYEALKVEFSKEYFWKLSRFVKMERELCTVYPPPDRVFAWTQMCDISDMRVVIVGQNPYHRPGQANGLAFSVSEGITVPRSLKNIYKELKNDIPEFQEPCHGILRGWAEQGVLLLNASLTVREGKSNSHTNKGWGKFTDAVIEWLHHNLSGLVFMLWGNFAQKKLAAIDKEKHYVLKAAHPSPLSALRGFMGCGHFSKCNKYLKNQGGEPIDWACLSEYPSG